MSKLIPFPTNPHVQPHPTQPLTAATATVLDPLRSMYAASWQVAQPSSVNGYRQTWQHLHNTPLQINAPFVTKNSKSFTPTFSHQHDFNLTARWPATAPPHRHPAHIPFRAWPAASNHISTVSLAQVHPKDAAYDRSRLLAPLPVRSLAASPSPGLPWCWTGSSHSHSVSTPTFRLSTPSGSDVGQVPNPSQFSASVVASRAFECAHESTSNATSKQPSSDDNDEIFGSEPPSSEAPQAEKFKSSLITRRVTRSALRKPSSMAVSTLLSHSSSDDTDIQTSTSDTPGKHTARPSVSKAKITATQGISSAHASTFDSLFPRSKARTKLDQLGSVKPPKPRSHDGHPFKPRRQAIEIDGDLYTPRWVCGGRTGEGPIGSKEGWCGMCALEGQKGSWHNLRNSSYRYHMLRMHGISSKTGTFVADPLRVVRSQKVAEKLHGQCHECSRTIFFSPEYPPTPWFVHAAGCHAVVKAGAESSDAEVSSNVLTVTTRFGKRAASVTRAEAPTTKRKAGVGRSAAMAGSGTKVQASAPSKLTAVKELAAAKKRRGASTQPTTLNSSNVIVSASASTISQANSAASSSSSHSFEGSAQQSESEDETTIETVETDVEMAQLLLSFSAPGSNITPGIATPLTPSQFPNGMSSHAHSPRRSISEACITVTPPRRSPSCGIRSRKSEDKENLPIQHT